jgi:O-antigen ligase
MLFRIQVLLGVECVAAVGTLIRPFWGLLFLILLTFTRPQDDRPNMMALHIPMAITWSLIVATVFRPGFFMERLGSAVRRLALYAGLCIFLGCAALANGYTVYSQAQLEDSITLLVVGGLVLIWVTTPKRVEAVVYTLLAAGLYYVQTVMRNPKFMHEEIAGAGFDRLYFKNAINFGNPNFLAVLMVIVMFLALAVLVHERRLFNKAVLLAALAGYAFVFMKCQSRGATMGFAAGMVVFWMMRQRKALTAILIVTAVAGGLTFLAPTSYLGRLNTIVNYQEDKSATNRLEMWAICSQVIASNPILGMGPGNFEPTYPQMSPHNAYLQVAAEAGVPALLLYVMLLLSGYRSVWIARRLAAPDGKNIPYLFHLSEGLLCVLIEITVQGFFTGFAFREFVYISLALTYCIRSLAENASAAGGVAEGEEVAAEPGYVAA